MKKEFYQHVKKTYKNKPYVNDALKHAYAFYRISRTNNPKKDIWEKFRDISCGDKYYKSAKQFLIQKHGVCSYCREKIFINHNLHIDHILPKQKYPYFTFVFENLTAACLTCNILKEDIDFFGFKELGRNYRKLPFFTRFYHPNYHIFSEHVDMLVFQTNNIYMRVYTGNTRIGYELCKLHLYKISNLTIKSNANPEVYKAIENLNSLIIKENMGLNDNLKKVVKILIENI